MSDELNQRPSSPFREIPLPSKAWLEERLSYDPETGELRWKDRASETFKSTVCIASFRSRFAGKIAGCKMYKKDGSPKYIYLRLAEPDHPNRGRLAHRLIWVMMTGEEPPIGTLVDHKNRNPFDNRWRNLRLADYCQNSHNAIQAAGKCLPGVAKKKWGSFTSQIRFKKKCYHLGSFKTELEAHEAYKAKSKELRGEFCPFTNQSV
jgi:hypothetical protein